QCRGWLDQHYAGVPRVVVASNAEAARQAAEDPSIAAIAGEMAADRYGLRMLSTRIEDHPDNKTRFLVLGQQNVGPSGKDKTSILVSVRNEPGALLRVLEPFQRFDISLSRIETRPARSGDWSYVFFIDFDGHQSDTNAKSVIDAIGEVALEVRSLGSYPNTVVPA
ncbi:MAG: prephenate dehydratase domain-containing protein, partial [Pseudomonadota bacterium]|nr:prephenate dehydratase domain-containing protein [Pseudomonadota bacterium]